MQLIEELQELVRSLEVENARLKEEVAFLRTHPTLSQGIRGETLVGSIINGKLTSYAEGHDLETPTGVLIEVKFSKLNEPVKGSSTRRWNWSKPLGHLDKGKRYDLLLLVGESDERYPEQYERGVPYAFFVVPYEDVRSLMDSGRTVGGMIQLTSNFEKLGRKKQSPKLLEYRVDYSALAGLVNGVVSND